MTPTDFSNLPLNNELQINLQSLGFSTMMPVQAEALPLVLAGGDVIAQAQTGSGKTVVFGLGVLNQLDVCSPQVQALVLCPTRELADQVAKVIRQLARQLPNIKVLTLCGGMPFRAQVKSLEHGAHIVVGTPGRVGKLMRKGGLNLKQVRTLVLDEGDRMLEMGFQLELEAIEAQLPKRRQTLLFSATYPEGIQELAASIMSNPVMIQAAALSNSEPIEQHFYRVRDDENRLLAVRLLLHQRRPESTLIFCNTKVETQRVSDALEAEGFSAQALNGDLEQRERNERLIRFSNKSVSVLVATDVAARGLDIDSIDLIVNYHVSPDLEVHVHRIGRTGRAGKAGVACSLYAEKERHKMAGLAESMGSPVTPEKLPPLQVLDEPNWKPPMVMLKVALGKKHKIRPGNLLGMLTGEGGLDGSQVGGITLCDSWSYVAVQREVANRALNRMHAARWKDRSVKCRILRA